MNGNWGSCSNGRIISFKRDHIELLQHCIKNIEVRRITLFYAVHMMLLKDKVPRQTDTKTGPTEAELLGSLYTKIYVINTMAKIMATFNVILVISIV